MGEKFSEVPLAIALVRTGALAVSRGLAAPPAVAANRVGAGVWDFTLAQGVPGDHCQTIANCVGGAANSNIQIAHTSDTVKRVTTQVAAGAGADIDFDVSFSQLNP